MDLGLRQKDVAVLLGANHRSYENWETGKHEPEFRYWPGLIQFLGYDPSPEPRTLGERIWAKRRREGLSQEELARKLGLDPGTVVTWEAGEVEKPWPRLTRLFEEYVEQV
jgi:transcriptional regulator with XRE-family HTH domain